MTTAMRFAAACEAFATYDDGKGVPFVAHGRNPDVGFDCAGLLLAGARAVGIEPEDVDYVLVPGADVWRPMVQIVETVADPVTGDWERGDILGFRYGPVKNHLGVFLGGVDLVHCWDMTAIKRVVVTPMDPMMRRIVVGAWRLR